jgi:DNA replication and repair protein RecF
VRHFRCFDSRAVEFAPGLNFIVGPNARGKTSLLEAACILLRLASPRVQRLAPVIQHGRRGFVVDGYFGVRHLQFYYSAGRKKLALDSVEQKSAEEYLRLARVMWFSNADIEIARGAGEVRRRFLDFLAVQMEPGYRAALRDYERALRSRNLLLKSPSPRWREIAAFDAPLLAAGTTVAEVRRRIVAELQPEASAAHGTVSGTREALRLAYVPGGAEDFPTALKAAEREDARLRQTTVGPHRDELTFFLNETPAADFASEGQQRTLVLALRLGAARLLERRHGEPPVLLLDDIFGELDLNRRGALLAALPAGSQKLITTTHLDWLPTGLSERVIDVCSGGL